MPRVRASSNHLVVSKGVGGFPDGSVAKNLPANTGDTGSIPCPGRCHLLQSNYAHEPQLLKPEHLEPVLCNRRSLHGEARVLQLERSPALCN